MRLFYIIFCFTTLLYHSLSGLDAVCTSVLPLEPSSSVERNYLAYANPGRRDRPCINYNRRLI